jgi:hypothetical protein
MPDHRYNQWVRYGGVVKQVGLSVVSESDRVTIRLRIKLEPRPNVSSERVDRFKKKIASLTEKFFGDGYEFVGQDSDVRPIQTEVLFVESGEDLRVRLHQDSRPSTLTDWDITDGSRPEVVLAACFGLAATSTYTASRANLVIKEGSLSDLISKATGEKGSVIRRNGSSQPKISGVASPNEQGPETARGKVARGPRA